MTRLTLTTLRDARGIALPLALLSLLLFTSLALALIAVAQTEPTIAANHLDAAQARAVAESGIAHALWTLTETGTLSVTTARVSLGGFDIAVTGTDPHVRVARVVGWSAARGARATVVATLARVRDLAREMPCALCIAAPVALDASVADARGSETTDCGAKVGVASTAGIAFGAASAAYGGGAPGATAPIEGRDWRQHQPLGAFLSADDLQTLKALAVLRGRYIRPASDGRVRVTDIPDGLVFVDTPAGAPALTPGNVANVALGSSPFRGWLIANGDITLEAGADVEGVLYAVNAIATEGPATVTGLAVARHALGGDASLSGVGVRFDCSAARASVPRGWFLRPGTYCDGTAGC